MTANSNMPGDTILIEIAYAEPQRQQIEQLRVAQGITVAEVLAKPLQLKSSFPRMRIEPTCVGIFSKHVSLDQRLRHGDRIEIYRPLSIDPKEARRQRAARSSKS